MGMESNVELLERLFARFNETGDLDYSRVDPEVELHSRPDVPDGRVWSGLDGLRAFFAETAKSFDPIRWEPREFIPAGRHVLVRAHIVARGASSGAPIEVDEGQLWTFRNGMIVRLQAFPTIADAREAARALDQEEAHGERAAES
jgi:ketosteroid isomerase-like protein